MIVSTSSAPADFGVLLGIAYGAFKEKLHAHLSEAGFDDLGPSYGFVFRALADAPLSLAELAERLQISPQGAHKVIAEMVDRGYVEREDDERDRRVRRLHLSSRGRAALKAARRFHARVERELVDALGATKLTAARTVLEAFLASDEVAVATSRHLRPF